MNIPLTQAARSLGVCYRTLHRRCRGGMPHTRDSRGFLLVDPLAASRWLEARRRLPAGFMSEADAAAFLGIARYSLARWTAEFGIRHKRFVPVHGRPFRIYHRSTIDAFVRNRPDVLRRSWRMLSADVFVDQQRRSA